ncbi:hypothetical protein [Acidaminococcus fermentans]|uniref:hypothetical protein n=1 Tax=Acidaminococcus fermentans TaxID=905 RepID=UPI003A93BD48
MEETKNGWGGRRPNQTGRPKGTIKPEGVRSQHQLRAYDEEWDLIRRFARLVKHGKMEACKAALDQLEAADGKKTAKKL